MSKTFIAVSALIGTIIGAGFLGIPYVVSKSGFGLGLLHLVLLGILIMLVTLYLGEIALRTKTNHHLSGYAERYLGQKGKLLMFLAFFFGATSAIVAYLIGEGESLSYLFFNSLDYRIHFAIVFWLILSAIVYFGIKSLEEGGPIGIILILILTISIFILNITKVNYSQLQYNNFHNIFVPFGVVLFSYLGFSIIPEIERILGKDRKEMKRTIISGYLICFAVYVLFTFIVLGVNGVSTPEIATLALGKPFILLGMLSMFIAYLSLSVAVMDTLRFDFKVSGLKSWITVVSVPLIIMLILEMLNKAAFTKVIGIGGVVSGGITAVLILIMVKKAKIHGDRKPEYSVPYSGILAWVMGAIFVLGAIAEIISLLR